jgi:hypothetical protein
MMLWIDAFGTTSETLSIASSPPNCLLMPVARNNGVT